WGRPDLGVRAATADGRQVSVRYLPWTEMVQAEGGNNYRLTGVNWPANTRVTIVLCTVGAADVVVGTATTDANGIFQLLVALPDTGKHGVEIRAKDQPYFSWFTL